MATKECAHWWRACVCYVILKHSQRPLTERGQQPGLRMCHRRSNLACPPPCCSGMWIKRYPRCDSTLPLGSTRSSRLGQNSLPETVR